VNMAEPEPDFTIADMLRAAADEAEAEEASRDELPVKEIIKISRDEDFYVGWSHIAEAPVWAGTYAEALADGCPPSRLRRADETGSSMHDAFGLRWDHGGLIAEQRGYLPRARIGDYALAYLDERLDDAFDMLEPFEDMTP
jgi:hypothetical protein